MPEGTLQPELELKSQPPIGEANKLGEHAKDKSKDRLLLFSQVKNKVVKVNPDVQFPLNIEEGKPTPVGLFAERTFAKKTKQGEIPLEVLPRHLRTALLARIIFRDNQGNLYRDVDLKGMGLLSKSSESREVSYKPVVSRPGAQWAVSRLGLLDKETAIYDYENGEDLSKSGVRVARTLAIIELQELIVDGEKISVNEATKREIIDKDFKPVIEVRAFGTRARIHDLLDEEAKKGKKPAGFKTYETTTNLLLEDAKKIVAQELGKESITDQEYLEWFAQTLAKNIVLLHKNGWAYGYLHDQNITLDCRLVDFDSLSDDPYANERIEAMKILVLLWARVTRYPGDIQSVDKIDLSFLPRSAEDLLDLFGRNYNNYQKIDIAA